MNGEDEKMKKKPSAEPGILINAQFGAATKQFRKMTTSCKDDSRRRKDDGGGGAGKTDSGEIPGEDLREKTPKRTEKVRAPDTDQSGKSWGEFDRASIGIHGIERRRTTKIDGGASKRDSSDSNRTSCKRAESHNILSPHESVASIRGPADLFPPAKTRCRNEHVRDSPPCLRRTSPRFTGPPLSSKLDPTLLPEATKQRGDMGKVADVLLTLKGEKRLMWRLAIPI